MRKQKKEEAFFMDENMQAEWETCKREHYAEDGERPDLSRGIAVPEDIRERYEASRSNVITNRRYFGIIGAALMIGCVIRFSGTIGFIEYGTIGAVVVICLLLYLRKMKAAGSTDVQGGYIDACVQPIVSRIDPGIHASKGPEVFPLYGTIAEEEGNQVFNAMADDRGIIGIIQGGIQAASGQRPMDYNELGSFLAYARVLPANVDELNVSLALDSLQGNREGFSMINAEGVRVSVTQDSDGHTHRDRSVVFNGSILAVRMKHHVRCDVAIFTSKKNIFGREKNNGYRPIPDTVDTENAEFNENFEAASAEESQAFLVLSPVVMENLLHLKETYGNFGMCVHDDFLIFGMNYGKQPLSMPKTLRDAKKLSLEQSVQDTRNLLRDIYTIKDAVDLNFRDQTY